jgi:hypothetical protein
VEGSYKYGNESAGSIKCWKINSMSERGCFHEFYFAAKNDMTHDMILVSTSQYRALMYIYLDVALQ